ncbi:hypothetical protein K449DRAFT_391809 [Hypoxylon sp. EC38]|nr:hypothetical protein K449DRAFT_391809 [Hypoxylon sp. EC38]
MHSLTSSLFDLETRGCSALASAFRNRQSHELLANWQFIRSERASRPKPVAVPGERITEVPSCTDSQIKSRHPLQRYTIYPRTISSHFSFVPVSLAVVVFVLVRYS